MKALRKTRGFTLVELMIVVAIIGILAAIAIPNFMRYQLKSKRSEGSINVNGIRTAELSYQGFHDVFVADAGKPAAPTTAKQAWCAVGACGGFDTVGWRPEGQVYAEYAVSAAVPGSQFTVTAVTDIDGDAAQACWGYYKNVSEATLGCTPTKPEQVDLVTAENIY